MNCLIFMMGGSGVRFGAKIPKQYVKVNGMPVFAYTLGKYCECSFIDKILIVSNSDWIDYTVKIADQLLGEKLLGVISGGRTRSHSVKNGVNFCENYLDDDDIVLIHDASNPFLETDAIKRAIEVVKKFPMVCVGTDQYHTLYKRTDDVISRVVPRETVCSGYSPELFRFSLLYEFYAKANDETLENMTSAMALALSNNIEVKYIPANIINLKITRKNDMEAFKLLIRDEENILTEEKNGKLNEVLQGYVDDLIRRYPKLESSKDFIISAYLIMVRSYENGGKLLIAGNGGSAADSEHIAGELMKSFRLKRSIDQKFTILLKQTDSVQGERLANNLEKALPAIPLVAHEALSTAYMNDVASQDVFAQQLYGIGDPKDVFLGISTSGNSRNIINAAIVAKSMGMKVIGLTGKDGGEMKKYSDVLIQVNEEETYAIQELHLPVYHCLCMMLEEHFFGD